MNNIKIELQFPPKLEQTNSFLRNAALLLLITNGGSTFTAGFFLVRFREKSVPARKKSLLNKEKKVVHLEKKVIK